MEFGWKRQVATVVVTTAVLTISSLSTPRQLFAQARAALMQDIDQPARAPFQATVAINANNFTYTGITIPSGKRLVVEYVNLSGAAASAGGAIQPLILLQSTVAGSPAATLYLQPVMSTSTPTQYYLSAPTTVYADSLSVGPAYAGFSPSFMVFNVVITGHLVSVP